VFLAHAAAVTELFVALQTREGEALLEFYREPREPFRDSSRERTLAPDALVVLASERDQPSLAFVEMDLGTMSHARLQAKAEMYAAFAASGAWRDGYEFLPALVFLTTSEPRALRFLHVLRAVIRQKKQHYTPIRLAAAAGPVAFAPGRMLEEACLTHLDGERAVTFFDVLTEARAPFDRERRAAEKRRRTKERKRAQIREDPLVVRRLLRRESKGIVAYLEQLDEVGGSAIEIAIASNDDDLLAEEHTMLQVVGHELGDILIERGFRRAPAPTDAAVRAVADLAERYQSAQRRRVDELAARYGEGPSLRRARTTLADGKLLHTHAVDGLADRARSDSEAMVEQQQQRAVYEQWREHAAAGRVKQTGLLKQRAHSREEFYAAIDDEHLWVCSGCEETVYPELDATGADEPTKADCHYCGRPADGKPRTDIPGCRVIYL
jgi:Replication-relaxation